MKYMGSLYAVDDKERTIAFYKEVCGLRVIQDFGTNFTMTGGISFQTRESWSGFLEKQPSDIHYGAIVAGEGNLVWGTLPFIISMQFFLIAIII